MYQLIVNLDGIDAVKTEALYLHELTHQMEEILDDLPESSRIKIEIRNIGRLYNDQ